MKSEMPPTERSSSSSTSDFLPPSFAPPARQQPQPKQTGLTEGSTTLADDDTHVLQNGTRIDGMATANLLKHPGQVDSLQQFATNPE